MTQEVNATTVIVNGEVVAVHSKPKYKRGVPKVKSNASLIGSEVHVTQNVDFTEATGQVTLALVNTVKNIELMESWQDNIGKNAIRLVDNDTGFTKTFNNMSVTDDFEIDFSSEETEIVFNGGKGI